MVRATYGEVYKLFGGASWPAGWSDANVTNLCAIVDDELDEYELSASDQGAVTLANMIVYRRILHAVWALGPMTTPEPRIWTQDLLDLRNRLSDEGTYEFMTTIDTVDEDG